MRRQKYWRSIVPTSRIFILCRVVELLEDLKKKNIKIGIITDGRPEGQRAKIHALNLLPFVDDCIITDELGGVQFRKPCDIAFRIMLNRWRFNSADVVYVGDNPAKDFQAPQQLGMRSLYFQNQDGIYCSDRKPDISQIGDVLSYI